MIYKLHAKQCLFYSPLLPVWVTLLARFDGYLHTVQEPLVVVICVAGWSQVFTEQGQCSATELYLPAPLQCFVTTALLPYSCPGSVSTTHLGAFFHPHRH